MQQVKAHGEAARQTTAQRGTYATKLTKEASTPFFTLLTFPAALLARLAMVYKPPTVSSERKRKKSLCIG